MNITPIPHCMTCGGSLILQDNQYKCLYCGNLYETETAEARDNALRAQFDELKLEHIHNLRRNLYNAVTAKYISREEVRNACTELKNFLPDDFTANFYATAASGNLRALNEAIGALDPDAHAEDMPTLVTFLIRSLNADEDYLVALNDLVERAFKKRDARLYLQYVTEVSEQTDRIYDGIYEATLARHVFVAYSGKDMPQVIELVEELESQGISCFVAARNLRHGLGSVEDYDSLLKTAMDNCRILLFVSGPHSRNFACDALRIELAYIKEQDIQNSPPEYRNNYETIPHIYKKPRVEYRFRESARHTAADTLVDQFFHGYERVYAPEQVADRVAQILFGVTPMSRPSHAAEAEAARRAAEEEARRKAAEEENLTPEEEAAAEAATAALLDEEAARKATEEAARKAAKEEAKRKAEEEAKRKVEAEAARKAAEEAARKAAKEEAKRKAEEEAKRKAEAEAARQAAEEAARKAAKEEAARKATEEAARKAEAEAARKAAKEEARRKAAEEKAARKAAEADALTDADRLADGQKRKKRHILVVLVVALLVTGGVGTGVALSSKKDPPKPPVVTEMTMAESSSPGDMEEPSDTIAESTAETEGESVTEAETDPTPDVPPEYSQGLEYMLNGDGASYRVTGIGTCTDAELKLSPTYKGVPVTYIADNAFSGNKAITEIIIPGCITTIGSSAFNQCEKLSVITYQGTKTQWEEIEHSDYWRYMLASCTVRCIDGSYTQEDLRVSEGLEYILDGTSYTVSGIGTCKDTEIIIPATHQGKPVTEIGEEAFDECGKLTSITIPDSVTSIGSRAFHDCSSLTSITIPNSVTSIDDYAFYGCWDLTSITIPDSVTSIGKYAFSDCSSLTSIIVSPDNPIYHSSGNCLIETATKTLIAGCQNSIIPADGSVTSIGDAAFASCSSLTSITIPDSVIRIGEVAFVNCDGLTSITIGDNVTSIGIQAFRECDSLTSITIGGNVTSIDSLTFGMCGSLTSITVSDNNPIYHSSGNCLIETATKTLVTGCQNSIIPTDGSVTSIASSAFYFCRSLTSITIPDSVTSIGVFAFYGCSSLTSITIPNSVTSIGDYAFSYCHSLTTITFQGTKSQWNAIQKGASWNSSTPTITVRCTDGDIKA